jgi:hypothetical protein
MKLKEASRMRTAIEISESVFQQSQHIARNKGFSVEQLIVRALERELADAPVASPNSKQVSLPLIASKHPGSLDLANFDFDDLLN